MELDEVYAMQPRRVVYAERLALSYWNVIMSVRLSVVGLGFNGSFF
jgi:hypothetical protein